MFPADLARFLLSIYTPASVEWQGVIIMVAIILYFAIICAIAVCTVVMVVFVYDFF